MSEPTTTCEAAAGQPGRHPDAAAGQLETRLQEAEAEVARLTMRVETKEKQLRELRMAFAHSATLHYAALERLECELEVCRAAVPSRLQRTASVAPAAGNAGDVTVCLPYMTGVLAVLIDTMRTYWAQCDRDHAPKSSMVARAIDERLHLRSQPDGSASRSAQAYAAAIRPDWMREEDNRHHHGRRHRIRPGEGVIQAADDAAAMPPGTQARLL